MVDQNMHISISGLELIKLFEGFVGHIYNDSAGLATCGYGHLLTAPEKTAGLWINGISKDEATQLLAKDVMKFENQIKQYIGVEIELNQNMFNGLTSMLYNTGAGPIISGGLGKAINKDCSDFETISTEWLKWCKRKDPKTGLLVIDQGLLGRRKKELALYMTPMHTDDLTDEQKQQILNSVNLTITANLDDLYDVDLKDENS